MLNDIAHLPLWKKVNTGMLRLYEGNDRLDKRMKHYIRLMWVFRGCDYFPFLFSLMAWPDDMT